MPPEPGLEAAVTLTVTAADTAISHRSGDVPVLATPRLIALCEEATVAAVAGHLEPGRTTVGVAIEFEHLAASPVGAEVTARARVVEADGRALEFAVTAHQGDRVVGRGRVRRLEVDRAGFLAGFRDRD